MQWLIPVILLLVWLRGEDWLKPEVWDKQDPVSKKTKKTKAQTACWTRAMRVEVVSSCQTLDVLMNQPVGFANGLCVACKTKRWVKFLHPSLFVINNWPRRISIYWNGEFWEKSRFLWWEVCIRSSVLHLASLGDLLDIHVERRSSQSDMWV